MKGNKNLEPYLETYLPNGTRALVVSLNAKAIPLPGPDTVLQFVKDPTETLRPKKLEVSKYADPSEVLSKMAQNPRANLYLV